MADLKELKELQDIEGLLVAAGVTVAFRKKLQDGVALGLRVQPGADGPWHEFVKVITFRSAVMAAEVPDGEEAPYFIDVSKVFYYDAQKDAPVWLWRIVLRGDLSEISDILTRQDFSPRKARIELTSFPLVGRIYGKPDSLKGIHPPNAASQYVAQAAMRKVAE